MKNILIKIAWVMHVLFWMTILVSCDIEKFLSGCQWYITATKNITFLMRQITGISPIIILVALVATYYVLHNKWVFRIERLNLGGMNIVFNKPENFFKQQVKNFLNTKRTLFRFDAERDNIKDTIGSFYNVYEFLREELKIYDIKSSGNSTCYELANNMIKDLNNFLTTHQDNYRRWIDYEMENNLSHYNLDIKDIQKGYRHYDLIIDDIKKLNEKFRALSKEFEIDIEKWN